MPRGAGQRCNRRFLFVSWRLIEISRKCHLIDGEEHARRFGSYLGFLSPETMAQNLGFDVNPDGTRLVILQIVFLVLAWVICLLRLYVKVFMQRRVLSDDWFMFASLVSSLLWKTLMASPCSSTHANRLYTLRMASLPSMESLWVVRGNTRKN